MERLMKIAACIAHSATVADIGCDHGLLEQILLEQKKADRIIATDISAKSLKKSQNLCEKLGLLNVDFRVGNGFSVLEPGEADTVVIAGMGGITIAEMLKSGERAARATRELVLCPHSHIAELRKYLYQNNFRILAEKLVLEEGKYYQIICAADGKDTAQDYTDEFYFEIGKKLLESKDDHLKGFLENRLIRLEDIISRASNSEKNDTAVRIRQLCLHAKKIKEELACL